MFELNSEVILVRIVYIVFQCIFLVLIKAGLIFKMVALVIAFLTEVVLYIIYTCTCIYRYLTN